MEDTAQKPAGEEGCEFLPVQHFICPLVDSLAFKAFICCLESWVAQAASVACAMSMRNVLNECVLCQIVQLSEPAACVFYGIL